MATNNIGKGTCNVTINVSRAERALLGRKAFQENVSLGEYLRRAILRGVRDPLATEITAIREQRRKDVAKWTLDVAAAVVMGGLLFVASARHMEARRNGPVEIAEIEEVEVL